MPQPNSQQAQFTRNNLRDTFSIGVIGVGLFAVLRWLVPISHVPTASMEPSLPEGSKVLVSNVEYWFDVPQRGDVVVFDSGFRAGLLDREVVRFTKRIVGLPGETIEVTPLGEVYIDGELLEGVIASRPYSSATIAEEHYFMLGDNHQDDSYDSTVLGAIAEDKIEGRVMAVVWPPGKLATVTHPSW